MRFARLHRSHRHRDRSLRISAALRTRAAVRDRGTLRRSSRSQSTQHSEIACAASRCRCAIVGEFRAVACIEHASCASVHPRHSATSAYRARRWRYSAQRLDGDHALWIRRAESCSQSYGAVIRHTRCTKGLTMRWSERRTAVRSTFEMTSTLPLRATRALVRRRSSCSR